MTGNGILYVVGTPIGNTGDISARASEVLSLVDLIAAEDTRKTGLLLNKLGIKKRYVSYHEHNKVSRSVQILDFLSNGGKVALVSDAGMPCISDPGYELVAMCDKNGFEVVVIPGPCAAIAALAGSGFNGSRFIFEGFLPVRGSERKKRILDVSGYEMTCILYEAPHRLLKTLSDLKESQNGYRKICIAREMTKKYEEFIRCTIDEAIDHFSNNTPKGEFVIIIEGQSSGRINNTISDDADELITRIEGMLNEGCRTREIVNLISGENGMSRNDLYAKVSHIKKTIEDRLKK